MIARAQLLLIDAVNAIGDVEHRHAPGKDFVAQERIAFALALLIVELEDRFEDIPIYRQFDFESRIISTLFRIEFASIGFQRRIHFRSNFLQSGPIRFRALEIRLEQIIPHVGSGQVKV